MVRERTLYNCRDCGRAYTRRSSAEACEQTHRRDHDRERGRVR